MTIDGKPITGTGTDRGVVFQHYSLFPWMTARNNVAFGIKQAKKELNKRERLALADEYLDKVGLGDFADKYPNRLSGGMQQRVAIARAVAVNSKIILADEPTGNLDHNTSMEIFDLFKRLVKEYDKTVIMVTHNEKLAMMCDKVLYMDQNIRKLVNYECS